MQAAVAEPPAGPSASDPTWRRGRLWALLVCGALLLAGCASLRPPASALAQEPVLRPPVDAVELGRTTRDPQRGWLMGIDSPALLEVVYAVPMSPEQAGLAWVQAYGEQYGLSMPGPRNGWQVFGEAGDVGVQLEFGYERLIVVGAPRDYKPVPPGSSVVTVILNGRTE